MGKFAGTLSHWKFSSEIRLFSEKRVCPHMYIHLDHFTQLYQMKAFLTLLSKCKSSGHEHIKTQLFE